MLPDTLLFPLTRLHQITHACTNHSSLTLDCLHTCVQGSVYGFSAADGSATCVFRDLHSSPITSLVYAPASDTLVTSTLDSAATVGGMQIKVHAEDLSVCA
jgi:hypothetical protein